MVELGVNIRGIDCINRQHVRIVTKSIMIRNGLIPLVGHIKWIKRWWWVVLLKGLKIRTMIGKWMVIMSIMGDVGLVVIWGGIMSILRCSQDIIS